MAILCGGAPAKGIGDRIPLPLATCGIDRNVNLPVRSISQYMLKGVSTRFIDLLEIAAYIYSADQAVKRHDDVENMGAGWARDFLFRIPVSNPDLWCHEATQHALESTLGLMTDDRFSFDFVKAKKREVGDTYFHVGPDADQPDDVVLFSGGLDSLGGAIQSSIANEKRVLFVGHRPSNKLNSRIAELESRLVDRARYQPHFVNVPINKASELSVEDTQRTRSLLFAAIAGTIAHLAERDRIWFFENGIISLNISISAQLTGAKASKTTHPAVLKGLEHLISIVAGHPFSIEAPFLWKTKTDVVRDIVAAGCGEMIPWTTSCAHTRQIRNDVPHCGRCSQCVSRRFAVLAAGASEFENETGYRDRLFLDPWESNEERALITSFVETASRMAEMEPAEFFSRYGEAFDAIAAIEGSSGAVAQRIFDLHKRHANEVVSVIDAELARNSTAIRRRILDEGCLLRMVANQDPVGLEAAVSTPSEEESGTDATVRSEADYVFRPSGRGWMIRYAGGEDFVLLPSPGAAYLRHLLRHQGRAVPVDDLLVAAGIDPGGLPAAGDGDPVFDDASLAGIAERWRELKVQMARAQKNCDEALAERLAREHQELMNQVQPHLRRRGKSRPLGSDAERRRKSVWVAIDRVRKEIAVDCPPFAEHIRPPILRCGCTPVYDPPHHVPWML